MKFISYWRDAALRTGVVCDDGIAELDAAGVPGEIGAALYQGVDLMAQARQAQSRGSRLPLAGVHHAPAVPRPGKILCMGLNYFDHAREGGKDRPDYPWFFMRGASSLVGHGEPAVRPRVSGMFDYEAELAVVIGRRVRHATLNDALQSVFGYSCFNDMSLRDYQRKTPQWTMGKNFDGTGAFGPWIVSADELPPGGAGLQIASRLNGQVVQHAHTGDMMWSVAQTLVLLTECMTLEPGDVVIMGTPAGVGAARQPPLWLKHGDRIEVEIERIGVLANVVQDEVPQP
ncbi:MAG: FAA hydrolase family protein [Comamonadaceae bacterium]|nr:MAG: FAA hydrolase family protein [Comamonadaceae bacterium]